MPKRTPEERAEIRRQAEAERDVSKDRAEHEASRGKPGIQGKEFNSLASIARRELDNEEFLKAVDEFHSSSDRVAAIMGAALVEQNLQSAIRSVLIKCDDKELFNEQDAPFGTLKNKAVAGYALGLYNRMVLDDLHVVRKIRNQFAHALMSIDFGHPTIAIEAAKLKGHPYHGQPRTKVIEGRKWYETACWSMSLALMRIAIDNHERSSTIRKIGLLNLKNEADALHCRSTDLVVERILKEGRTK